GVIGSLKDAAANAGIPIEEMLGEAVLVSQGSTIGTNILINRDGARTGLLTTRGFEDTIQIMRAWGRVAGLSEQEIKHQSTARKPEPLIPKWLTKGVIERIDYNGTVIVPLQEVSVRRAIEEFLEAGVESIAISFLWSFANPAHEQRVKEMVKEMAPEVYVQASSDLIPQLREYARTNTTVIDAYIGPAIRGWFTRLQERLQELGYSRSLLTMQANGGVVYAEQLRPINSVNSGPAGGVIGSKYLADLLGHQNVITSDVGGTSFDVSVIADWKPMFARDPLIHRFNVLIPMLNIVSIGAGGGTIARADPVTGRLKVGPDSTGAMPGPACYGRGGTIPTVTDANLVLGYLNPDYFLGGRMRLDVDRANAAIDGLGRAVGMDRVEAAAAVYEIVNAHMSDISRTTVTMAGYDPRHFVLFAFGGAGPLHACAYGRELGVQKIYMFPQSSVFSAFGIGVSDIQLHYKVSEHHQMPADPGKLQRSFEALEARAVADLQKMGLKNQEVGLIRQLDMKFRRQYYEETIEVPRAAYDEETVKGFTEAFVRRYEQLYGRGAAYMEAGIQITALGVIATVPTVKPVVGEFPLSPSDPSAARKGTRDAYFTEAGGFRRTPVYDGERLKAGNVVDGPAIIEVPTTTVVIPPGMTASVDPYLNLVAERGS
ncbi:MAG: hydantoinase/oxoprolinase family protein, partial [Firmicutes bacterium]|nr:hydantoinase/oxoprolinase family protein [Bacillota bacterium]